MAKDYKTVLSNAKDEFVEKRSRFIGYCKPVTCEQEAVDMMAKAKIDALCRKIDDEDTVQLVQRYLEGVMADGE